MTPLQRTTLAGAGLVSSLALVLGASRCCWWEAGVATPVLMER